MPAEGRPGVPGWGFARRLIDRAPMGSDEKLRLQHYTVCLILGVPTLCAFAARAFMNGETAVGAMVAACAAGLTLGWALLRRGINPPMVYRMDAALFGALVVLMTAMGGGVEGRILWTYTYPLIAFFLLGRQEGLIWSAVVFGFTALILLDIVPGAGGHDYATDLKARFLVSLFFVGVLAYWFENYRTEYRLGMEAERSRLEMARSEVKILSGLLPICANCKKIRDDQGYWQQIETYVDAHSEARFSHGICPDCLQEHYPDLPPARPAAGEPGTGPE